MKQNALTNEEYFKPPGIWLYLPKSQSQQQLHAGLNYVFVQVASCVMHFSEKQ